MRRHEPARVGRDAARERCGVARVAVRAKPESDGGRRALRVLPPTLCRPIVPRMAPERGSEKSARRFSPRGARGGDAPPVLLLLRHPALDRRAARRRRGGPAHPGADASHRPSHLTVKRRSRKAIRAATFSEATTIRCYFYIFGTVCSLPMPCSPSDVFETALVRSKSGRSYHTRPAPPPFAHPRFRVRGRAHAQRRTETAVARWTARSA